MMTFNKTLMIDPPSGWKFGLPKPVPETFFDEGFELGEWLVSCGYPVKDVPLAIKYSRYWETDNEE